MIQNRHFFLISVAEPSWLHCCSNTVTNILDRLILDFENLVSVITFTPSTSPRFSLTLLISTPPLATKVAHPEPAAALSHRLQSQGGCHVQQRCGRTAFVSAGAAGAGLGRAGGESEVAHPVKREWLNKTGRGAEVTFSRECWAGVLFCTHSEINCVRRCVQRHDFKGRFHRNMMSVVRYSPCHSRQPSSCLWLRGMSRRTLLSSCPPSQQSSQTEAMRRRQSLERNKKLQKQRTSLQQRRESRLQKESLGGE